MLRQIYFPHALPRRDLSCSPIYYRTNGTLHKSVAYDERQQTHAVTAQNQDAICQACCTVSFCNRQQQHYKTALSRGYTLATQH